MRVSYYTIESEKLTNRNNTIRVLAKWCKGIVIGFAVYAILYLFAIGCGY